MVYKCMMAKYLQSLQVGIVHQNICSQWFDAVSIKITGEGKSVYRITVSLIELAAYSFLTLCCMVRGSSGKLVRPACSHSTESISQGVQPPGQDWASVACKAADNTIKVQNSSCGFICILTVTAVLWPGIETQCSHLISTKLSAFNGFTWQ